MRISIVHPWPPFTDWRLVTYAFALTEECKYGRGYTKRALRLAMNNRMRDEVRLQAVNVPFISPLDDWAHAALKPSLLELCASRNFLESSIWNGPQSSGRRRNESLASLAVRQCLCP
jgi:hypothetical protein